jgi:dihydrofolate synthase/folylpolyglutamate synthase
VEERIRVDGGALDRDLLGARLREVLEAAPGLPTYFEALTAAAFLHFHRASVELGVFEVGLGGRLDATNVVDEPLASVITPISLDHERFLGTTVEEIAAEKAGILKRGRPAIIGPQPSPVLDVIEAAAARKGADLFVANRDWVAYSERGRLVYQDEDGLIDLPSPRLAGRHQFANAGAAIATLRHCGAAIATAAIETGLTTVDWPARLQRLGPGPLLARAQPDAEIWLDGGHNPGAGIVIAEAMADIEERAPRPLYLITAMLSTKNPVGFFRPFAGLARKVFTVPVPTSTAGRDPDALAEAAGEAGLSAAATTGVHDALAHIAGEPGLGGPPRILICGNLNLAGAVLGANGTPPV